jgi:ASC-1-like (ASCH) protein
MPREYVKHLSEPWFSLILHEIKTIEGRRNMGDFNEIQVGDTIRWQNFDFGDREVVTEIVKKNEYISFYQMLKNEGISKCLPSINKIDKGESVYYKYYTKEEENEHGVVALHLKLKKHWIYGLFVYFQYLTKIISWILYFPLISYIIDIIFILF